MNSQIILVAYNYLPFISLKKARASLLNTNSTKILAFESSILNLFSYPPNSK